MKEIYVYIGGFELPDKNAAANRVIGIGKLLRDKGKEIVYIGTSKSVCGDTDIIETKKTHYGFSCYEKKYPQNYIEWISYLCNPRDYIKIIKRLCNVRAVIFYDFPSIALSRLMNFCKKRGILCYADVTEWYVTKGNGVAWQIIKGFDTWYRMSILHKKMDGLIVISKYLEEYYKDYVNTYRIPVVIDIFDKKWKCEYTKSNSVLRLVYAGFPRKKDRIDTIIEALKHVKRDYKLDIIGISKKEYLLIHQNHNEFIENNSNIEFHSCLSHIEVLDYIKRANYSCFFREDNRSTRAGFPTKFVEAIGCGTPVITNNSSDLMDYCYGVNGLILESLDTKPIVEIIENCPFVFPVNKLVFDYREYKDVLNI